MKVLIKAGTNGWFEDHLDASFIFPKDVTVEVVQSSMPFFYQVQGTIPEFPEVQSPILINQVHIR